MATKLCPDALPVHCATGSEHPDNDRFERDCVVWFGRQVVTLRSDDYMDTWDVWEGKRYIAGIDGAPCTLALNPIAPACDFLCHITEQEMGDADR